MDGQNRDEVNEMRSSGESAGRGELNRERKPFPLLSIAIGAKSGCS